MLDIITLADFLVTYLRGDRSDPYYAELKKACSNVIKLKKKIDLSSLKFWQFLKNFIQVIVLYKYEMYYYIV